MCFDIKNQTIATVAEKDIKCFKIFKIIDKQIYSPIRPDQWAVGVANTKKAEIVRTVEEAEKVNYRKEINAGLHCFPTLAKAIAYRKDTWNSGGGILPRLKVLPCVIPKGSLYWKNASQYCADRLYIVSDKPLKLTSE